jgi:hypothetical protein
MAQRPDLNAIRQRAEAATPGPWLSLRDGNQRINTHYLPTAKLVGASRIVGPVRPWNPYAYIARGFTPEEFETVRFVDEDADFVAHAREDIPSLVAYAEALEEALREFLDLEEVECRYDHHGNCQAHGACPPPCYVAEARALLGAG